MTVGVVLPLTALFLVLLTLGIQDPTARSAERIARTRHSGFAIKGASIIQRHENGTFSSFSASRLESRNRTGAGGLIVYNDVGELVAFDVVIEMNTESGRGTPLSYVFDSAKNFFSLDDRQDPLERRFSNASMFMTRIQIQKFSMRLHDPLGGNLELSSQKARLNLDPETLVLDGRVVITIPDGEEIRSSRAVFSTEFDGVYLPDGHEIDKRRVHRGAFLVLDGRAMFTEAGVVPKIAYDDYIAEKEKLILNQLLKTLPQGVRPLLGAALGHPGMGM